MTSNRSILFMLLMVGISGIMIWKSRPVSLCGDLSCISMRDISAFQSQEIYSDTLRTYRALYSNKKRLLRIEARSAPKDSSEAELKEEITKVKSMFEKAPAPYPGEISDAIVCDSTYKPQYREFESSTSRKYLFVGFLNNRLTFGSCSQNQAVNKGALVFMYCPNRSLLIRLELIAPTDDFQSHENEIMRQVESLQCVN